MLLATSHPRKVVEVVGTDQRHVVYAFPAWAVVLVYVVVLGILIVGVLAVSRAAKRMSKPARIVVALVVVWTIVGATAVFLDAYRPAGDWGGSAVEGLFVVLYGLIAAGIVWAVDRAAKRCRATSPA
jgi:hypothetical protein